MSFVLRDEAERLAAESNMRLYRTSVKDDMNVGSVFQHLAENYVNRVKSYDALDTTYPSLQIGRQSPGIIYQQTRPSNNQHNGYNMVRTRNINNRSNHINNGRRGVERRFSNYADPCTDYLNSPMFNSLHNGRRYWPGVDRTITIKPLGIKKHSNKGISLKNACRVL